MLPFWHCLTLVGRSHNFWDMSLTQIKEAAANLPPEERRELIAYLIALQTEKDEAFKKQLAAKIDDRDPAHWFELNEVKKRYGE